MERVGRQELLEQLLNYEPLGFIDPFSDLGEFDSLQKKFKQPVKELVNRYSGQPYSLPWQHKIIEMRKLFIAYQIALNEEDKQINFQRRTRSEESKEHANAIVTTYLKLGFSFKEIEKRVSLSYKQLRRGWRRSDHVMTSSPEFYSKQDLSEGCCLPSKKLPDSMRINEEGI